MRNTNMRWLLLGLVALTVGLTAGPAAAQTTTIIEEFVLPAPPSAQYCYTQSGHWAWDGTQYVWMPEQTVCEYR